MTRCLLRSNTWTVSRIHVLLAFSNKKELALFRQAEFCILLLQEVVQKCASCEYWEMVGFKSVAQHCRHDTGVVIEINCEFRPMPRDLFTLRLSDGQPGYRNVSPLLILGNEWHKCVESLDKKMERCIADVAVEKFIFRGIRRVAVARCDWIFKCARHDISSRFAPEWSLQLVDVVPKGWGQQRSRLLLLA